MFIAIAGALGALSRWSISRGLASLLGAEFPYGTLCVNLIGCFWLGFIMHIGLTTDKIPPHLRIAVTVGFLGALTTFSTFSYETITLLEQANWMRAGSNILANVLIGLTATFTGLLLARTILGGNS